ncbi:MAG: hypothetical protein ACLKAK_07025 [Alkaliphilus sp.]
MIKLIVGKKGTGKTKKIIIAANDSIKKAKGYVVFIDFDNRHMFQIDYRGRFVGVKDYIVTDDVAFSGFISGIVASNYDIETIYIDALLKITKKELNELEVFFSNIEVLTTKYNVEFVFTISSDLENLPEFLKKHIVIDAEEY